MSDSILILLFAFLFIAALLGEDFILTLIYLFVGVFVLGHWWSRRALQAISVRRSFSQRVFLGEKVPVQLEIANQGLLPAVWLQMHESLPVELFNPHFFRRVVSLGPRQRMQFEYVLEGRKRGYYALGPLMLYSGDVLGVVEGSMERKVEVEFLTVYPKIIPLAQVKMPSHSPMGTLRHTQPIFEDPTRVIGKRDYVDGDSLRRVDWKATATTGRLQVKQYEPSIALETSIFLNLNASEYDYRRRIDSTELAIIVAASLANWVTGKRQAVGLVTNGIDPLMGEASPAPVPPRRGRSHLMRILDVLARVKIGETFSFVRLLRRESVPLSWGTTLLLVTSHVDEDLFDALFQARRAGLNAMILLAGQAPNYQESQKQAAYFGFPLFLVSQERDLDMWRH